jgi:hypothetical protein
MSSPVPSTQESVISEQQIVDLRQAIAAERRRLLEHPLYEAVRTIADLQRFMQLHVFAVWDFMSLVKRLQRDFTCTDLPWVPPADPELARFVNEVVLTEESDRGPHGEPASHLELYLAAMREVGADQRCVRRFLHLVGRRWTAEQALATAEAPAAVRRFVNATLETAQSGTTLEVLASFLFGREDLIPDMFSRLLEHWKGREEATYFRYYVERHIQLDGDEHGPIASRALIRLAGADPAAWRVAAQAARQALEARIRLWDAALQSTRQGR